MLAALCQLLRSAPCPSQARIPYPCHRNSLKGSNLNLFISPLSLLTKFTCKPSVCALRAVACTSLCLPPTALLQASKAEVPQHGVHCRPAQQVRCPCPLLIRLRAPETSLCQHRQPQAAQAGCGHRQRPQPCQPSSSGKQRVDIPVPLECSAQNVQRGRRGRQCGPQVLREGARCCQVPPVLL